MSAYLGIDAGNTGVKAVLFDGEGRALASAHRDTGGHCPAPGMVERDVGRLRTDLDGLVREVLHKSGLKGGDIAGIGTSGHGNGLYLLDADGAPVAAIQSLDTRAAGLVEEWDDSGVADAVERICLQRPWAAQTPALLAWMARHRPEAMARAAHLLMCKDLVTHALTGEIASDVSDMGGAGLLRLPANAYDDALLDAYGLADSKRLLPKLHWPVEIVGRVTAEAARAHGTGGWDTGRRRLLRRDRQRGRGRGDTAGAGIADPWHMEHQPGRGRDAGRRRLHVGAAGARTLHVDGEFRDVGDQSRMAGAQSSRA